MVKNMHKEQMASLGRYAPVIMAAMIFAIGLAWAGDLSAATFEATPNISIKYGFNDNVYAEDPDEITPVVPRGNDELVTASYLDYLLGLTLAYRQGRNTFSIHGDAGYEQYLTITGWVEDAPDSEPGKYDYMTMSAMAAYSYASPKLTFELSDTIRQTRDLQAVFGAATDAIGYWSLYTDNIVSVSVKSQVGAKLRTLLQYNYETLDFADPENDLYRPADSVEHRVFFRSEYTFTGHLHGIVDAQAAQRTFDSSTDPNTGRDIKNADYNLYQGMIGIIYFFNPRFYVTALGGYAQRNFDDLSDQRLAAPWPAPWLGMKTYDLENMGDPVGRLSVTYDAEKINLDLTGCQGVSTYGQNLFFNYSMISGTMNYKVTPNLNWRLNAQYRQAMYDVEKNGRDWLWDEDRVDKVTFVDTNLHWDILKKRNQGTLMLEVGYTYQNRDSNIDGPRAYNPVYLTLLPPGMGVNSDDAKVDTYYVKIQMLPTILFGR